MFGEDSKFLTLGSEETVHNTHNIVSYCSFPRMGNSFLRMYLQKVTGIATGADMTLELDVDLQLTDFKGQEIIDDSVWIRKSHDPKMNPNNITNKCNKVICCVRNPYDTIFSLINFMPTG